MKGYKDHWFARKISEKRWDVRHESNTTRGQLQQNQQLQFDESNKGVNEGHLVLGLRRSLTLAADGANPWPLWCMSQLLYPRDRLRELLASLQHIRQPCLYPEVHGNVCMSQDSKRGDTRVVHCLR